MDNKKTFCGATTHTRSAPLPKVFLFLICFLILNCEIVFGVEEYNTDPTNKYMSIDMASAVIERIKVLNSSFNVTPENFANSFNNNFFNSSQNTLNINFLNINLVFSSDGLTMYILPCNNTFSNELQYMYFKTLYNRSASNTNTAYIYATESQEGTEEKFPTPYVKVNLSTMVYTWITTTGNIKVYATNSQLNNNNIINEGNSILTSPYIYTFVRTSAFYYQYQTAEAIVIPKTPVFSGYCYKNYKPVEEEPGDGGDTSGDTGGGTGGGGSNVDLGNIEQGIGDINNNLGEINNNINNINNNLGEINNTIKEPYNPENSTLNDLDEETLLDNMGYKPTEDENQDLWDTIINGLKETLTGSGTQEFSFKLRKTEHTISSDDIYIPNGEIKIFISLFVNFWLLMQMFQFIKRTIDQINEGNLKVMHDVDADCYFF